MIGDSGAAAIAGRFEQGNGVLERSAGGLKVVGLTLHLAEQTDIHCLANGVAGLIIQCDCALEEQSCFAIVALDHLSLGLDAVGRGFHVGRRSVEIRARCATTAAALSVRMRCWASS